MVVNFRICEISQEECKLVRIFMLIKKKQEEEEEVGVHVSPPRLASGLPVLCCCRSPE
jgi:hypothetical protein